MSRFMHAMKAALKAAARGKEPISYEAAETRVICSHCRADKFYPHEALLNTGGATLMHLDWLDDAGTALICANCGLIHWFIRTPTMLPD